MRLKIQKVSGYTLYALLGITAVVVCLFFFGEGAVDTLLCWIYLLLGIAVVACIVGVATHFASLLADAPQTAVKSFTGAALLALVLAVSWWAGSETPLDIPGHEDGGNDSFWLKTADMLLYTIYTLMGVLVLLIVGNGLLKHFRR